MAASDHLRGRVVHNPPPHWPWTTYPSQRTQFNTCTTPGPSYQNPRSSVATSSPTQTVPSGSLSWSSLSNSTSKPNTTMAFTSNSGLEDTTRHWSFTAFEWVVRDVHKLRDYVECKELRLEGEVGSSRPTSQPEDFEVLKESPMLGDGKFKLEIGATLEDLITFLHRAFLSSARTPAHEGDTNLLDTHQSLSLFITSESLIVDFDHAGFEMYASMMAAIKCQDDRAGERGARAEWVWTFWQSDWAFRQGSEVWECQLPLLSTLLENARVRETDSFVLCVQIHCPIGPFFPQQPSAYYVPRDLLEGLEGSLDNSNTGDVQFVCLERLHQLSPTSPTPNASANTTPIRSSSASSSHSFTSQTTARKRIIYAHSDILTKRSEYFATMLASSFSENSSSLVPGERKVYTVVVEEADFETMYWLLKWVYANWLLFKEQDDPRAAVEGVGAGWSVRWLHTRGGEWDWKTFRKANSSEDGISGDNTSVASVESMRSTGVGSRAVGSKSKSFEASVTPRPSGSRVPSTPSKPTTSSSTTSRLASNSIARRTVPPSTSGGSVTTTNMTSSVSPAVSRTKAMPIPSTVPTNASHYPISPRSQRQPHSLPVLSAPDPHVHPTPPPAPASALSMYQVAHRYSMPHLAALALEHMMSTITPESSFALLLAASIWEDLRLLVEDYIVERWQEVSCCEEFEQCCQEVAAGEWGPEGGKTFMALFRRLRSPTTS